MSTPRGAKEVAKLGELNTAALRGVLCHLVKGRLGSSFSWRLCIVTSQHHLKVFDARQPHYLRADVDLPHTTLEPLSDKKIKSLAKLKVPSPVSKDTLLEGERHYFRLITPEKRSGHIFLVSSTKSSAWRHALTSAQSAPPPAAVTPTSSPRPSSLEASAVSPRVSTMERSHTLAASTPASSKMRHHPSLPSLTLAQKARSQHSAAPPAGSMSARAAPNHRGTWNPQGKKAGSTTARPHTPPSAIRFTTLDSPFASPFDVELTTSPFSDTLPPKPLSASTSAATAPSPSPSPPLSHSSHSRSSPTLSSPARTPTSSPFATPLATPQLSLESQESQSQSETESLDERQLSQRSAHSDHSRSSGQLSPTSSTSSSTITSNSSRPKLRSIGQPGRGRPGRRSPSTGSRYPPSSLPLGDLGRSGKSTGELVVLRVSSPRNRSVAQGPRKPPKRRGPVPPNVMQSADPATWRLYEYAGYSATLFAGVHSLPFTSSSTESLSVAPFESPHESLYLETHDRHEAITATEMKELLDSPFIDVERAKSIAILGWNGVGRTSFALKMMELECGEGAPTLIDTQGAQVTPAFQVTTSNQRVLTRFSVPTVNTSLTPYQVLGIETEADLRTLDGLLLMFDLSDRESFSSFLTWILSRHKLSDRADATSVAGQSAEGEEGGEEGEETSPPPVPKAVKELSAASSLKRRSSKKWGSLKSKPSQRKLFRSSDKKSDKRGSDRKDSEQALSILSHFPFVLCGTHGDCPRQVKLDKARSWAKARDSDFVEVSLVEETGFALTTRLLLNRIDPSRPSPAPGADLPKFKFASWDRERGEAWAAESPPDSGSSPLA